jgi:hypothetical protein
LQVALAVRAISQHAFFIFANVVFEHIEDFSDEATYNKTRAEVMMMMMMMMMMM